VEKFATSPPYSDAVVRLVVDKLTLCITVVSESPYVVSYDSVFSIDTNQTCEDAVGAIEAATKRVNCTACPKAKD
jgi:hypothetical protein